MKKLLLIGFLFSVATTTGAVTRAIPGALIKKKFLIGGRKEVYHDQHSKLMQRLVL